MQKEDAGWGGSHEPLLGQGTRSGPGQGAGAALGWWQKGLVGQRSSAPQPQLGLTPPLPLQGYHRSNHFIATQGESSPPLHSLPDSAAGFCPWGI